MPKMLYKKKKKLSLLLTEVEVKGRNLRQQMFPILVRKRVSVTPQCELFY